MNILILMIILGVAVIVAWRTLLMQASKCCDNPSDNCNCKTTSATECECCGGDNCNCKAPAHTDVDAPPVVEESTPFIEEIEPEVPPARHEKISRGSDGKTHVTKKVSRNKRK